MAGRPKKQAREGYGRHGGQAGHRKGGRQRRDHEQELTNRIIEQLEAGTPPWRQSWAGALVEPPRNGATGRAYRGVNALILSMHEGVLQGDPRFYTIKQANDADTKVKKGERSMRVFFYATVERQARENDDRRFVEWSDEHEMWVRRIPVLRSYPVFHASQIEGLPAYEPQREREVTGIDDADRPEAVLEIVDRAGVVLEDGRQPAYSPERDVLILPSAAEFDTPEGYAATALHELAHWTGGDDNRVPRRIKNRFGSDAYAKEELRAELAATFACARLGIPCELPQRASYIDAWTRILKRDKNEILRAAGDAQRIADHLVSYIPEYDLAPPERDPAPVERAEARPGADGPPEDAVVPLDDEEEEIAAPAPAA